MTYSLVCAFLMNVPFSLSLTFARHVPTAELALIFSLSPLINFAVGAITGRDPMTARRALAIAVGFAASCILVVSREGTCSGQVSWWLLASFINPFLFAAYNWFAQRHWPRGGTTFTVGAAESFWSGVLALPFMLVLSPPWVVEFTGKMAVWSIAGGDADVDGRAHRLLHPDPRASGAIYTLQAVYLSAPTAVIFAVIFFGGATDIWLWLSLAILMVALWLNNSGPAARQRSA